MKTDTKLIVSQGVTATSNTTSTFVFDSAGASRAVIDYWTTQGQEVTNAPAVLKVGSGTNTSSFTYIDAFTAGTGFTATTVATATTLTNVYRFDVDTRGLERYIALQVTPPTGQGATVLTHTVACNLFRIARDGSDATGQNVLQLVQG
jgi:hypothetical protein